MIDDLEEISYAAGHKDSKISAKKIRAALHANKMRRAPAWKRQLSSYRAGKKTAEKRKRESSNET